MSVSVLDRRLAWGAICAATLAFQPLTAEAGLPFGPNTVADVAERVTPAVVSIQTQRTRQVSDSRMFPDLFHHRRGRGRRRPPKEQGAGSGVVISPDGYIVTNNHVIEKADKIIVRFNDRSEYEARLIGTDKPSDLALLKIDAKNLPSLELGDSKALRLGEFVLAIGNPFGVGQTVTMGIVSAKGRSNVGIVDYENFIQTDAAINPGNSGGALVNLKGQLVGINTAIVSRSGGAQGIGFAVPTSMVQPILSQIREHGRVRRGWLGVAIQDLNPDLAAELDLKGINGVLISDVLDGGPAQKGGLRPGDVVLSVNRKKTKTSAELRNHIALLGPGAKATLTILRKGRQSELRIRLDEKEDKTTRRKRKEKVESPIAGVSVQSLSGELREQLGAPDRISGVVVTNVDGESPAAEKLREGDIITSVNHKSVRKPSDLDKLVKSKAKKVLMRVWREGTYIFLVLTR